MSNIQYSPNQLAIFNYIKEESGSLLIEAVAGSGKSFTILECLWFLPEEASVQYLAFNAPIAAELGLKLQERRKEWDRPLANVRSGTFHSVGMGAVNRFLKGNAIVKGDKCRAILKEMLTPVEYDIYGSFADALVGYAKGEGIGPLVPDTMEAWTKLVAHHDLSLEGEDANEVRGITIARMLLDASNAKARADSIIDFNDMLYLPVLWRLRLWQHDYVFGDEMQDTNPVRRALCRMLLRPGGRLVAVGDRRQGIYGFTGASHDALDLIKKDFNCKELPLSVCYRCAVEIVKSAQKIVPHIKWADNAPTGEVLKLPAAEALKLLGPKDAIICRQTKPLVKLAYKLISKGIPCYVMGREIGDGLIALIDKMRTKSINLLLDKLEVYREREVAAAIAKGQEQRAEGVEDRVECIKVLVEVLDENSRTISKLKERISSLFLDKSDALTLATIHKSKGKEWETVVIYMPELMPSLYARQAWQQEQERNLDYVARTRARLRLIFSSEYLETPAVKPAVSLPKKIVRVALKTKGI